MMSFASLGSAELEAIRLSVKVSLAATLVCLVPGTLLGVWLARTRSRLRLIVDVVVMTPLVMPPVVTGLLLLMVLRALNRDLLFTWWAAMLASAILAAPLLIRTVRTSVEGLDPRLARVAETLGASRLRSLRTITLPLAWKGIVGGATLAWAKAVGEFGATIVVAGNIPGRTRTIPLAIWTAIQNPTAPSIFPLIVAAIMLSVLATGLGEWLIHRENVRRSRARTRPAQDD